MSKVFKTAPLPFQGQKRRFVGSFALALQELKKKQDSLLSTKKKWTIKN
ncbi:hypothetical protein [Dysgonomonas sp. 511]|nr:hypothetical protein [Dysgonomonas sp. 511]